MNPSACSPPSQRRRFLRTFAWLAGGAGLLLGRVKLFAGNPQNASCSAELEKSQKALTDRQFEDLRDKARYVRRLREKFGPGVIDEARKLTIETAEKNFKNAAIPPEQRNLEAVRKVFTQVGDSASYTWVVDTPEHMQARVTRCRWAEELRKDGNDGELGYALACAFDIGFCAGLNPKIKFTRTKTLMMGDDHCNHTYELKA